MANGYKTGGRQKGTLNNATADVKALAGQYTGEAVACLVDLMRHAESEQVRVAAARELLDRGYGRPPQHASVSAELTHSPKSYKAMTDEELLAIVYEAQAEREREPAAEAHDG